MPATHPPLFASLEALLDPELLAGWMRFEPGAWQLIRQPMEGGLSGATLERITLTNGDIYRHTPALILKRMDPATNWLMRAAGDTYCREARLTQSPLWERFSPQVTSPIIACALLEDGSGALLMYEVRPLSAELCYQPIDDSLLSDILDALASLHAACWQAPELHEAAWLATPADALLTLTPDRLRMAVANEAPEDDSYGAQALRMWPFLWRFIDPDDSATLWETLQAPERIIEAMAAAPQTLAHGDTWVANIAMLLNKRIILLDWALATAGPATFDSLWLAHTWHDLDPSRVLTEHRAALVRHGVTDVRNDDLWELLCDLAWLRTFYMGAEWLVRDVRGAPTDEEDAAARARLNFWSHTAAEIARKRGW